MTDTAVHLAVVAHSWLIVGLLAGLRERIEMVAAPRSVLVSCVEVDTEHDGAEDE